VSDSFWDALFVALPATLAALITLIVTLRTHRQVQIVEKATNSLTNQLVASTKIVSHAAGVKEERERPRGADKKE